jgi:hypothetical protein
MADSGNFGAWLNYLLTIQTEIGRKAAFEGPGAQEFFSYGSDVRRKYINLAVRFELKHIPRGERRSLQNSLRFRYSALRRKHIRLGLTRHETLRELVEKIGKAHPDFIPEYDKDFFKI